MLKLNLRNIIYPTLECIFKCVSFTSAGCPTFPQTWSDNNVQLQTETFFPIPYEQSFQLQCDEPQEKYRLFVGDRDISCGARGDFEYNTEPDCVLAGQL